MLHLPAPAGLPTPHGPLHARGATITPGWALLGHPAGAFVELRWTETALEVQADPLGIRQVFWTEHRGRLHLATRLRALLPVTGARHDPAAIRRYLSFGFMTGEDTGLLGLRRLPPGHRLRWDGAAHVERTWSLQERLDPELADPDSAAAAVLAAGRAAVPRGRAALYLSGGLDSSAVAAWADPSEITAYTLDLGKETADREAAEQVARHLHLPLRVVPITDLPEALLAVTRALDLPIGDPVTVPQLLLARAARADGHTTALNGEFGDQLFGGWTNKPMLAAALYGEDPLEEAWLASWHRFHGEPVLAPGVDGGPEDACARVLAPTLQRPNTSLLGRLRLTDLATKGSCSILPRAWQIAAAEGLELRMPLADPALAELAFRLPPTLKLRGAEEKHVLKRAVRGLLPDAVIDRRKAGMGAPANHWLGGPLRELMHDVLSDAAVRRRGLLDPAFVARLRAGEHAAGETRARRLGERVWTLLALELWLRNVVDGG